MSKITPNGNKKRNKEHDKIFKIALENKKALSEILNRLLNLKDKNKIKEEEIEEYKTEYITKKFEGRQADKVYKLRKKEVYFLIEHQSKVDKNMAERILEYKLEIKRDIGKKKKVKPTIIAIVIYSGNKKWKVPQNIEEEQKGFKGIKQGIGEYYLFDGTKQTRQEMIKSKNIILQLLVLEKAKTKEELGEFLKELIPEVRKEDIKTIMNIVEMAYSEKLGKEKTEEILKNMKGSDDMLAVVEMMRKEAQKERMNLIRVRKEGRKSGLKEGIKTRN